MEINIDPYKVSSMEAHNEGDGMYTICVSFKNGEFMVYGYDDIKKFIKDYTQICEVDNEEQN